MKKILITADTSWPKQDGVLRFIDETVSRLKNHFDITLIIPNFKHSFKQITESNPRIIKLPTYKSIKVAGYESVAITRQLFKLIKQEVKKADIIFSQDIAPIGLISMYYGKKLKKPTLCYFHQVTWEQFSKVSSIFLQPFFGYLAKKMAIRVYNRWCDSLIIPYKILEKELEEHGVFVKKNIVYLGVDSSTFTPSENKSQSKEIMNINPKKTVIGYLGRISREKNLKVLVKAYKKLKHEYPNLYLLIVGDGPKDEVDKYKDEPGVKITGFVKDPQTYLKAMDIFVMPSLTETTSLATMEAMSCELGVITTSIGFPKEYVLKNKTGLLFPKGNTHTLILQLKKYLNNPDKLKKIGKEARKLIKTFSWDKTANSLKSIFDEIEV